MHRLIHIATLPLLLLALGCDPPETDTGGSAPEVTGRIEGTVLYAGPRPECEYDGDRATAVRGNVVLLAFFSDNPPPPSGTATSAETLLLIPGRDIFQLADCLPAEPTPEEQRVVLTRSVDFSWPDIALADGRGATVDYQIRAFYDRDQDFNPFFSVRRLATRGDNAGGAFVNTAEVPPQFARITFGSVQDQPDGQVVQGVAVTLGALVNTELPASRLGDTSRGLSSEARLPTTSDDVMRETQLWQLTETRLRLIDPEADDWVATLDAAGMSINPHPSGFGWFILPVDADRDGFQDPHPVLGATAGVMWNHPVVIMRRARNPIELRAGVPDAVIVATTRPSQTGSKDTFDPSIDIAVPPIVAVNLDPTNPVCNIPYITPGNLAEIYERIPVDCQEIPTGNYDVNVLSGIAGGRAIDFRAQVVEENPGLPDSVVDGIVRGRTDNDWVIEGGSFSSQAWSIPNELGCPDPVYRPNALDEEGNPIAVSQLDENPLTGCGDPRAPLGGCDDSMTLQQCSQGPSGRFSVVDPDGTNAPSADDNSDGHGIEACQTTVRATTMMPDSVTYMDVPEACCGPIAHLCGLPLCPLRDAAVLEGRDGARAIREVTEPGVDFAVGEDGSITPLCTPFLMPASCCR